MDQAIPDAVARHYDAFTRRDFESAVAEFAPDAVIWVVDPATGERTPDAVGRPAIAALLRERFLHAVFSAAPLLVEPDPADDDAADAAADETARVWVAWTSIDPLSGGMRRGRALIAFTLRGGVIQSLMVERSVVSS